MITRDFLRSVDLFSGLEDADAVTLAAQGREEVFSKGQTIFRERDVAEKLYVIVSGVVEITKAAAPGDPRPQVLARLGRGEVLGEIAAFDRGPRSATALAAVVPETRMACWDVAAFLKFLADRPKAASLIQAALLRKMGSRLRQTSDALHILLRALPS